MKAASNIFLIMTLSLMVSANASVIEYNAESIIIHNYKNDIFQPIKATVSSDYKYSQGIVDYFNNDHKHYLNGENGTSRDTGLDYQKSLFQSPQFESNFGLNGVERKESSRTYSRWLIPVAVIVAGGLTTYALYSIRSN